MRGPVAILRALCGSTFLESTFFNSQIIAILAAILFPVFARAREKARQASCQSNLKQIGLAMMMYVQDYDEKYLYGWNSEWACSSTFEGFLLPYVQNEQIFICPSGIAEVGADAHETFNQSGAYSWAYDHMRGAKIATLSRNGSPAEFYLCGDSYWQYWWGNPEDASQMRSNLGLDRNDAYRATRHNDMANMCFADGHVKAQTEGDLMRRTGDREPPWYTSWDDM